MRTTVLPFALLAAGQASAPAAAADWRFDSGATLAAQSETNPRLRSDSERDVSGGSANLQFGLQRRTETVGISVDARLHSRRYTQDVSLDRDEYQLDATTTLRGERYQLNAMAAAGRDTTLSSELGTTGLSGVNLRREVLSASLAPTWLPTERLSVGTSLRLQRVRYLGNENLDLVDYRYATVGAQAGLQFSERTALSLVASADRLDSDRDEQATRDYTLMLQAVHNWSPALSFSLALGPSWVDSASVRDTGMRYRASVTHRSEHTTLSASASRSTAPAGRGLLTRREEIGVNISRQVAQFLEVSATGSYQRSQDIIPLFSFTYNDVQYVRGEIGLAWRFAEDWRLGLTVGGAKQHIRQIDDKGRNFSARMHVAWSHSAGVG